MGGSADPERVARPGPLVRAGVVNVGGPMHATQNNSAALAQGNTLKMGSIALAALLNALDRPEVGVAPSKRRRSFLRWPYRREAIALDVERADGPTNRMMVATRNLSRGGVSVLHNTYLHAGTRVAITLSHPLRGPVSLRGKIVRCAHRSGVVHEIGIAFDQPVNAREFVVTDPLANAFTMERVDAAALSGRVAWLARAGEDWEQARRLIDGTSLDVEGLSSLEGCGGGIAEADVLVLDLDACDVAPAARSDPGRAGEARAAWVSRALAAARDARFAGATVLLVPDRTAPTRTLVQGLAVEIVVVKPLSRELLLRALAEVLLVLREEGVEGGKEAALAKQMSQLAEILRLTLRAGDAPTLVKALERVRSNFTALGHTTLASSCEQALALLPGGARSEPVRELVLKIAAACEPGSQRS